MGQVIVAVRPGENGFDQRQTGRRALIHRDGHGPVQLDHRRGLARPARRTERNLPPIGPADIRRLRVDGRNPAAGVGAESLAHQRPFDQLTPLDKRSVPPAAILLQRAPSRPLHPRGPCGATPLVASARAGRCRSASGSGSSSQRPRRIASAETSGRVSAGPAEAE